MVSILCQFSWWSLDFLKIRLISDIRIEYWIQKLEYWITCTQILVQKVKIYWYVLMRKKIATSDTK